MAEPHHVQSYGSEGGPERSNEARRSILVVLWGAMLATHIAFGFVGFIVNRQAEAAQAGNSMFLLVFAIAALSIVVVTFAVLPRVIPRDTAAGAFNYNIIRWGMVESVSIFGFVLLVMGTSWGAGVVFIVVGAGLTAALYPRA